MICLDASVAVQLLIDERFSEAAQALVQDQFERNETIIAPPTMPFEVANSLHKRGARRDFTLSSVDELIRRWITFPLVIEWERDFHVASLVLAARFGISASYDADYIVLAERHRCDFWTDDRRLLAKLGDQLPFVRWIGDFGAAET